MLMQPSYQKNLVLIILKYLGKSCQTYKWAMFCLNGLMIQKLRGIIAFWGKIKIKNKIGFNATSIFCNVLESYLSIYILRVV